MDKAFIYKWTELSTNKWYIGSRTAKGCNPDDGYICSSKIVKPMIKENPDNWKRTILVIGESKFIRDLEYRYLTVLNAAKDSESYNKHNGGKEFSNELGNSPSDETRTKMSLKSKGHKRCLGIKHSKESKQKISIANKGNKSHLGRILSDEHRKNLSNANKGKVRVKSKCPHCHKLIDIGNMNRWHGDKCKLKS